MNHSLAVCLLTSVIASGSTHATTPTMPFDEVEAGMIGTGRTVFHGTQVEEFQVEILGKLHDIGPDQDLILGRLTGGPLAETGVMSGMSGSPVTVDGKLIGAVAYSWGFAKDAIAGITPIGEMLAIADRDSGGRPRTAGSLLSTSELLEVSHSPEQLAGFLDSEFESVFQRSGALVSMSIPLSVSGMSGNAVDRLLPHFGRAGFLPQLSGGAGDGAGVAPPLEPGSAVGLKLIRGDIEMTAVGTVTWIDGERLLAFGHPLFGLGEVDLPLTGAAVQALLPSLQQSSKMAAALDELGAIRQDRPTGVYGIIGAEPRMIPVRVQLSGTAGATESYSFDIADDPLVSPLLLYSSLTGILATRERTLGSSTIRLEPGSVIKLADSDDVTLDNLFAGPAALDHGTGLSAYILYLLMNNTWTQPRVTGVNLILEYEQAPRTARIRRATLSRYRARPGERLLVTIVVKPFRGPDLTFNREIVIPPETPPGELTLHFGGALATARTEETTERVLPQDLKQLVRLINQLRRNDRIYIVATREDSGVFLAGSRLPNLPPSAVSVLTRPRSRGNLAVVNRRAVLEERIDTEHAISGSARVVLEVVAP